MKTPRLALLASLFGLALFTPSVPAQTAAPTPPATVDELLANRQLAGSIKEKVQTANYGFFITERGVIVGVHGADGKILFNSIGEFIIQRSAQAIEVGMEFYHLGWINDPSVRTTIRGTKAEAGPIYDVTIRHPMLTVKMKIECLAAEIRIGYDLDPEKFPKDVLANPIFPVFFNAANLDVAEISATANPVEVFNAADDPIKIGFSRDFLPYNQKGPAVVVDKEAIRFYPFAGLDRKTKPKSVKLDLEISLPQVSK